MSSRSYCFTSFSESPNLANENFRYCIAGKEICPTTQRTHWQGYLELYNKTTIPKVKKWLEDPTAHLETRRGTREEARHYCMKDGQYTEHGDWSAGGQGARTDLHKLVEQIEAGKSNWELIKFDPEVFNKYQRFISQCREALAEQKSKDYLTTWAATIELNQFQKTLLDKIERQNNRQITWVTDVKGGTGKSTLAKYIVSQGGIRLTNAKSADISLAYHGEPIVVFDFCRSVESRINYGIIEDIKNGMIFSSKYKSQCKFFEPPKIICMANFPPDKSSMSLDRWDIITV